MSVSIQWLVSHRALEEELYQIQYTSTADSLTCLRTSGLYNSRVLMAGSDVSKL